jgi:hypothetical protein
VGFVFAQLKHCIYTYLGIIEGISEALATACSLQAPEICNAHKNAFRLAYNALHCCIPIDITETSFASLLQPPWRASVLFPAVCYTHKRDSSSGKAIVSCTLHKALVLVQLNVSAGSGHGGHRRGGRARGSANLWHLPSPPAPP